MSRRTPLPLVLWILCTLYGCAHEAGTGAEGRPGAEETARELHVFLGSATRPPVEQLARAYEASTGTRVVLHVGGSGQVLAQLRLAPDADVYLPGSSDYMEIAVDQGDVIPESEVKVAYLVPAINVPRGNPAGIRRLADLGRPGLKVGIARPDAVCVGLYAVEILEKSDLAEQVRPNIVVQVESCEKVAQVVSLGLVDAAIGWRVFESWDPDHIESILLEPEEVPRIGYVPAAIATKTRNRAAARQFLEFLVSPAGQAEFARWGYLSSESEARSLVMPATPVGGRWLLPDNWP